RRPSIRAEMITSLPALAWLALAVAPSADAGRPPPAITPKRAAAAVLEDYARALGGEAAWKRHKTLHMKRSLEVKGMQISGTEERYATANGKAMSVTTIPGMGTFREGSDGKTAWSEDPINGLRLLEGAEAEEAKVDATWDAELQLAKLYREVRAVDPPSAPPPGRRYECLELVHKLGKPA